MDDGAEVPEELARTGTELRELRADVLSGLAQIGGWQCTAPNPATVVQVLSDAHGLLAMGWSWPMAMRKEVAIGESRNVVCEPMHPDARSWPIEDAIIRAAGGDGALAAQALGIVEAQTEGTGGLTEWQGRAGRKDLEVLALVKRAMYRAAGEEDVLLQAPAAAANFEERRDVVHE